MDRIWKVKRYGLEQVCQHYLQLLLTAFTTGSVNNMHDSLTSLGGLGPMVLMMLNVVLVAASATHEFIDICLTDGVYHQLMVGKTPEYLNMPIAPVK